MTVARPLLVLFFVALASSAHAQTSDVHSAAAAFEEGQRAQLRGDFAQAADLFEIADRSAPSPAALRSAIRNHRAAHQSARAATLAAEAQSRYPEDAETRALAEETLSALTPTLGHVGVRCASECSVTLDGRALVSHAITAYDVYVDPGEHTVVGSWGGEGVDRQTFDVQAAQEITLELVAPAPVAEPVVVHEPVVPPSHEPDDPVPPPQPASSGVHPALFGTLAGLTLVGIAVTIGSGIDTLNAAADYRADPTHARYDDGVGRELRTNVLIGVTAAFAVAALVTVFFTDWDDIGPGPDERVALRPSFFASQDGGGAVLSGRYRL